MIRQYLLSAVLVVGHTIACVVTAQASGRGTLGVVLAVIVPTVVYAAGFWDGSASSK